MKQLHLVNAFMKIMGQEMPGEPCIPSDKIIGLRASLNKEEAQELFDAASNKDMVEVADALCDQLYVTLGAFTAYGFNSALLDELFDEVHASNMSKMCTTQEEAEATIAKYYKENITVTATKVGKYIVIARTSDNKALKSINFREPNLKAILKRHGVKC